MKTLIERAKKLKEQLNNCGDVIIRTQQDCVLMYIDGISDISEINQNVVNQKLSDVAEVNEAIDEESLIEALLQGKTVKLTKCGDLILNTTKYEYRPVSEPPTAVVIRGPREGFTENVKVNVGLIRKRLITKNLVIEDFSIGRETKTAVKVLYLKNIADEKVLKELREKLNRIDIDGIIDSYYIEAFISDKPSSLFRQVGQSEKPDIVTAKMLEGRIAIIVDGSPIVLTVPFLLVEDLQSSNDYYSNSLRATTKRVIRLIGAFTAVFVPGIYISLILYHYEIIPIKFLVTIINTTQNLPLSPFLEIFFIILLFEILFEASVRMPKYLGVAISIVGALILGDTAVKAGLVSPPGVMVVAISGITIYAIPDQSDIIAVLRLIFTFLGGILGLQGVTAGAIVLVSYVCNHSSFGIPYMAPYAPFVFSDQKDFVIKKNLTELITRPRSLRQKNIRRLKKWKE